MCTALWRVSHRSALPVNASRHQTHSVPAKPQMQTLRCGVAHAGAAASSPPWGQTWGGVKFGVVLGHIESIWGHFGISPWGHLGYGLGSLCTQSGLHPKVPLGVLSTIPHPHFHPLPHPHFHPCSHPHHSHRSVYYVVVGVQLYFELWRKSGCVAPR